MALRDALLTAADYIGSAQVDNVCKHLPVEWIEQALAATGTATLRRRRLPAEQVIWLVLGMALMRDRPIEEVVTKLDLALPGANGAIARSAIPQARARLGGEPMQWLFERSAQTSSKVSAEAHRYRGLSLYGIDGTTLRVADTADNRDEFGGASSPRGDSGYPQVRLVCLMVLRSHQIAAANFGPYSTSELKYALPLLDSISDRSLTIVDRGFFGALFLIGLTRRGSERHWMSRACSHNKWRVIESYGRDDALVEMDVSAQARRKDSSLPQTWRMRAVRYHRPGHQPSTLLTSLLDPVAYPAQELVALYHERWELELSYDELKTDLLDRRESIRSKKPNTVRQEIWGLLLAYNLVRLEMECVSAEARLPPTRISFLMALRLIRDEWLWSVDSRPGAIPGHLSALRRDLKRFILPSRRAERTYPRAVKVKMSNYARKRPL
ncbi:IS4 family transposase [Sorangium sp. So ce136]|uniref:IS4 family transposase n=1 Tax=Sorangium sp. So ce136 TaxID=3133284 RepID=UPI003F0B3960